MNKKITSALILILMISGVQISRGQLSGTYTIGGAGPDYATVGDAVIDLNSQGISAPVIFNIRDGVYPEKVVLTAIAGTTFTNTVTFQSESADSSLVTITSPASASLPANYTVSLTGASYITFHQVTIERSGVGVNSHVIEFNGGCDYNNFMGCVIINAATSNFTASNAIVYAPVNSVNNYNIFEANRIENGSIGAYFWGGPGLPADGNMFMDNQFINQRNYGLQLGYLSEAMITGNYITTDSINYGTAISASYCTGNSLFMTNKIELPTGGSGISLSSCSGGITGDVIVANNFIHVDGNGVGQAWGIRLQTCVNSDVYFNSVNNTATVSTTIDNDAAFNATGISSNNKVYNNIFVDANGYIVNMESNTIAQMDHNDLYSAGFNFGIEGPNTYFDFPSWKAGTGFDSNSVSLDPLFVSASDLHIQSFGLNGMAIPIPFITTDIDGDIRDSVIPDIGADEITPPGHDVGVIRLISPGKGSCGNDSTIVAAIVKNYSALPQSNINVTAEITGTQTLTLTGVITGPIPVSQGDTVFFSPSLNTVNGDSLRIKLYTSNANDEDNTNDTLVVDSLIINAIPPAPTVPASVSVCPGDSVSINATFGPGFQAYWFNAPAGGNLLQQGNPLTVSPGSNTTYYVEVRDTSASGGTGCLRITECELNDIGGNGDYVEIQNCSNNTIDATGWVVAVSNSTTDPNQVNTTLWNLGVFAPGEIQYRYDLNAGPFYWGENILWDATYLGWAMIVDNNGQVADFVGWDMTDAVIQGMAPVVNGYNISMAGNWSGDGVTACASGTSISRLGNTDQNDLSDWTCEVETQGTLNANISLPFIACGGGGCASARAAVTVDILTAPVVNLGNDTTIALPNTILLDAGAGFISFLWSTGATTETLLVNVSGTYTVTVTDSGGCTGTDVINVTVLTGISDFGSNSEVIVSPNPAKDNLKVTLKNLAPGDYTISLLNNLGQHMLTSILNVSGDKAEKIFDISAVQKGIYYIEVKSAKGVYRQIILIQ